VKPQRVNRKQIKNDPQVMIIVNRWIATTPSACYTRSLSHYSAYQIWHETPHQREWNCGSLPRGSPGSPLRSADSPLHFHSPLSLGELQNLDPDTAI